MNTIKKAAKDRVIKSKDENSSSSKKSPTIKLYTEFPQVEVSLDEFEEYALHRLKVRCKDDISIDDSNFQLLRACSMSSPTTILLFIYSFIHFQPIISAWNSLKSWDSAPDLRKISSHSSNWNNWKTNRLTLSVTLSCGWHTAAPKDPPTLVVDARSRVVKVPSGYGYDGRKETRHSRVSPRYTRVGQAGARRGTGQDCGGEWSQERCWQSVPRSVYASRASGASSERLCAQGTSVHSGNQLDYARGQ